MITLRFIVPTMLLLLFAGNANADKLSVKLTLADLPQDITLCRANQNKWYVDETFIARIDIDGDASTGDPQTGSEAMLFLQTPEQGPDCTRPARLSSARQVSTRTRT